MLESGTSGIGLERRTLSSQLYNILESKVLDGELQPGTRLSEESLAEAYGVSRSPAREALAGLERVGLAVRVGMRDRMITVPTEEMIAQKFDLWWIVDVGRAFLAAQHATPEDIAELRRYVNGMDAAVTAKDNKRYKQLCDKFHDKIRSGCPNTYVTELAQDCDLYLKWFETLYDKMPEISADVVAEHHRILDAYEKVDLAQLSETIRVHITRQRSRILDFFNGRAMPSSRKASRSTVAKTAAAE